MKNVLPRALATILLFGVLAVLSVQHYCPALSNPLAVDLLLPAGRAGQAEPLAVSGRTNFGDFLFVRDVDATQVIFGYDSWSPAGSARSRSK